MTTDVTAALSSLQIGGGWFPEQGGGLNRYFYDLMQHLPSVGVQCRGLVVGSPASWPDSPITSVRAYAPLKATLWQRWRCEREAVRAELQAEKFNVAALHFAPYALPAIGKLKSQMPVVVHFHGPWSQESKQEGGGRISVAAKAAIEKHVYNRADRLITLSHAFAGVLAKTFGISESRIDVVPGGINCRRFNIFDGKSEARRKLDWPTDRPIVLTVRRLARRMGLENLIDAASAIKRSVPDALVLIAGSGALRGELAERIDQRGLANTVRLLGFLPDADLPLAYRAADISVVPTTALEGFGLIAAESLAAGTPVLVTPVGGLPEVVAGLDDSLVLPDVTFAALAERLSAILRQQIKLPSADECRDYAVDRFDWRVVAGRIRGCYVRAL